MEHVTAIANPQYCSLSLTELPLDIRLLVYNQVLAFEKIHLDLCNARFWHVPWSKLWMEHAHCHRSCSPVSGHADSINGLPILRAYQKI